MKTYSVLFALDIPHYGTVELEATNDAAALEAAKNLDASEYAHDPHWNGGIGRRIVHIEAPDGRIVAEGVSLDSDFLLAHDDRSALVQAAAPALKTALERIAATPLCGEPIADNALKADLARRSEYDLEFDEFEPSCDTESSLLRDAVETARAALAALKDLP